MASMAEEEPGLFFPSSDDEDNASTIASSTDVTSSALQLPPTSNGHVAKSPPGSPDGDIAPLDAPTHSFHVTSMPSSSYLHLPGPSRKRPSPSPSQSTQEIPRWFSHGYLGEFVCEGWSLSKGKGYCAPGSKVVFERPKPKKPAKDEKKFMSAYGTLQARPGRLVMGKFVPAKSKPLSAKERVRGAIMAAKNTPAVSRISASCVGSDRSF
jgi:DNA repair protein RAD5